MIRNHHEYEENYSHRCQKNPNANRKQTFKSEYTKKYDFIIQSKRDSHSARCTICNVDFSIGHGGMNDIDGKSGHINPSKHQSAAKAVAGTRDLTAHFSAPDYSVIRAETLMVYFLIEHNLPLVTSDHFSDLMKKMFPDSKIARQFSCRRTKCTAIARTLGQDTKGE